MGFGTLKFTFSHNIFLKKLLFTLTKSWCPWRESDPRPLPYQGSALPLSHMGDSFNSGAGDGNRTHEISLEN
jgi:hypothetical protein